MNWIFKNGDYFQFDSNIQKAVVLIEQKINFTGEVGENVLILEKKKNEWQFTAQYRITDIEVKNPEAEYKQITIALSLVQQFDDEKLLEDYIYSLRRITNYNSPIKHFGRKYSRLFDAEFEAIVQDKIYLKRTILGTMLTAMHPDHQKAFIAFVGVEGPELLTGKADMDKALTLLLQYLDFSIVQPAQYLKESAKILATIVSDEELGQIGFASDLEKLDLKSTEMLQLQVSVINEYLEDLIGFQNEKLGLQSLELQENAGFKKLFRNSPLPITLN